VRTRASTSAIAHLHLPWHTYTCHSTPAIARAVVDLSSVDTNEKEIGVDGVDGDAAAARAHPLAPAAPHALR